MKLYGFLGEIKKARHKNLTNGLIKNLRLVQENL